ncbi:MAG TPA: hypothetical protein ENK92_00565 [Bacteroidetes bacterium]|uniref:Uncharacterized protein n=1 Tax=candidate division TA06 bacterium TaxID=2250710 RepID=A0A660SBC3_UNCT6|nr:MAG: hypothetical protein DRP44_00590 [candidate division TA06 bacterium]HHD82581.1 hypothetical protein [Bacteroidota bacterium]
MQDYSSLIRRCKDTSLNVFAKNTLTDNNLLYSGYFKSINIFSYNDMQDVGSLLGYVIDRISRYDNSSYAFYQFGTVTNVSEELLFNMLRWITIYDGVFLVNSENNTIVDLGLISRTFFKRVSGDNFWRNAFIKYIMPFEINKANDIKGIRYFTKSI